MTELDTTPICKYRKPGDAYEPCFCPVHDWVAELLGIVSTTGKDFRPGHAPKTARERYGRVSQDTIKQNREIQRELDRLKAEQERLEAEARRRDDIAAVSRRLLKEELRSKRPMVLGGGMTVEHLPKCKCCGTSDHPVHAYGAVENGPLEVTCDACHSNYHHFTSVRADNGASPGLGACL